MTLDYISRTLQGQWVYHQTLEDDHPELYAGAKAALAKLELNDQLGYAASIARLLANEERDKEIELIQDVFGAALKIDPLQPNFYTELIKALNYALSTRAIFERAIERIKSGESQITIAALVGGYIATAISQHVDKDDPAAQIKTLMTNNKKMQFADAANKVMTELLDKAVEDGITAALNSADFKGGEERAYSELIQYLNTNNGSVLISQLKQIWKIDELKNTIIQDMKKKSINKRNKTIITSVRKNLSVNQWQRGGLTAEVIEDYVINALSGIKSPGFHMEAAHTGQTEIKADSIVGFDIDMTALTDLLEQELTGPVSRERNVAAMQKVVSQLARLDDSFIVYSNVKNYSLSKNFKGFSAGEPISLATYENIMAGSRYNNVTSMVGALMNVIPGAIGDDKKEYLEKMLATDFANFMFDDVGTIGAQVHGARAIHVLYLDGIYVPLSYLLYELANAIEMATTNPARIIDVTINAPERLLFTYPNNTGMLNWIRQRVTAKEGISISVRFLSNFKSTIKSLFS